MGGDCTVRKLTRRQAYFVLGAANITGCPVVRSSVGGASPGCGTAVRSPPSPRDWWALGRRGGKCSQRTRDQETLGSLLLVACCCLGKHPMRSTERTEHRYLREARSQQEEPFRFLSVHGVRRSDPRQTMSRRPRSTTAKQAPAVSVTHFTKRAWIEKVGRWPAWGPFGRCSCEGTARSR